METSQPLVVGYVFRKKKASTFRATLQADLAGVVWKAVDLDALAAGESLADQGPFDVVLHKLSEDIHATFGHDDEATIEDLTTDDGDDETGFGTGEATVVAPGAELSVADNRNGSSTYNSSLGSITDKNRGTVYPGHLNTPVLAAKLLRAVRRVRALEAFAAAFPTVPVVDHPATVARVVFRARTCELLATVHGYSLTDGASHGPTQNGKSEDSEDVAETAGGDLGAKSPPPQPLHQFRLTAPRFVVAPRGLTQSTASDIEAQLHNQGVRGPLLVKPEVACGPAGSHLLTVVFGSPTSLGHRLPAENENHDQSHRTFAPPCAAQSQNKSFDSSEPASTARQGEAEEAPGGNGARNDAALALLARPSVVQEYVNHGGVLLKAYVIGNEVRLFARPSLPDLPGSESDSADGDSSAGAGSSGAGGDRSRVVLFDSQKPYPSLEALLAGPPLDPTAAPRVAAMAAATAAAEAATWAVSPVAPRPLRDGSSWSVHSHDSHDPHHHSSPNGSVWPPSPAPSPSPSPPLPPTSAPSPRDEVAVPGGACGEALRAAVHVAAFKLKEVFGLSLFGFDCVVPVDTADLMVLDVNYFPSYKELKGELSLLLRKHFTEVAAQRRAEASASSEMIVSPPSGTNSNSNSNSYKPK